MSPEGLDTRPTALRLRKERRMILPKPGIQPASSHSRVMCLNHISLKHRSENIDRAQRCSSWRHKKWSYAMFRSPTLPEAVTLAAFFSIHACFSLTADGTLKKRRGTGYVFQHSKRRKAKEKEVTFPRKLPLIVTCHHDVSAPLLHLKVLFQISLLFAPMLYALCSVAKLCYFYDCLKFYQNLGWVPKHGGQ